MTNLFFLGSTPEMYDDYNSLAWTRAAVPSQEASNDKEGETWRI